MSRARSALAGAAAALVWAAVEPLDRRLFRHDYSDVAMLGKLVTRSRAWPVAGLAVHAANGALFGLAFDARTRRTSARSRAGSRSGSRSPRTSRSSRSRPSSTGCIPRAASAASRRSSRARGLAQATFRHALFGAVLGRLAAVAR